MQIIGHETLVKNENYNAFPSIGECRSGRLVTVFRQADNSLKKYGSVTHVDPSSCAAMISSDDSGKTWSPVRVIYNDEHGTQDPCLTVLSDGTLICTFFQWKIVPKEEKEQLGEAFNYYGRIVFDRWAAMHIGTFCIRSRDEGESWEGPYPLSPTGWEGPAALRGNIVELESGKSAGRLLTPLYAVKHLGGFSGCFVMASDDKGASWFPLGEVPGMDGRHFLEPFLYAAPSGRLDMLIRTQGDFFTQPFDETYMPLSVSTSDDEGKSWSAAETTGLFCPNPVHVLPLSNGSVLLSYGQRRAPRGIEALVSSPDRLELMDTAAVQICPAESGDLGYTSAVEIDDETVMIVYYMTDEEGSTSIGASRVRLDQPGGHR